MHATNLNYARTRKRPLATAGELLAMQITMCVALLLIGLPLRESHPLLAGLLVGLYLWASFVVVRGIYRSPTGDVERRFGR